MRWLPAEVGGKLIEHGRRVLLTIAASIDKYHMFLEMRRPGYELLLH